VKSHCKKPADEYNSAPLTLRCRRAATASESGALEAGLPVRPAGRGVSSCVLPILTASVE
jgi:hypothetical protein